MSGKDWAVDFSNLVFGTKFKHKKKEFTTKQKLDRVNKDWDKEKKKLKREHKKAHR